MNGLIKIPVLGCFQFYFAFLKSRGFKIIDAFSQNICLYFLIWDDPTSALKRGDDSFLIRDW